MTQTLDQQRAAFAWSAAEEGMNRHHDSYRQLAKGAPALIMTSGLMPVLAFYRGKDAAHQKLLEDLMRVISVELWPQELGAAGQASAFTPFMKKLQGCDSQTYRRATESALETLKWIRQFVDAVEHARGGGAR